MDGQIEIPDFDDEPSTDLRAFGSSTSAAFGFNLPASSSSSNSKTPWGATNFNTQSNDFAPVNFNDNAASSPFTLPQTLPQAPSNFTPAPPQNASSTSLASSTFTFGGSTAGAPSTASSSHVRNKSSSTSVSADSPSNVQLSRRYGPPELALALVMDDFSHRAELKISDILSRSVDQELFLPRILAEGVDPQFDRVLISVAQLSKTIPNLVIDQLMRWRRDHMQGVDPDTARKLAGEHLNGVQVKATVDILNERKSLSSLYLLCRALTAFSEVVNTDLLANEMGAKLEEVVYNTIRRCNIPQLERSANRRANMDCYARLVGSLSAIRFQSVTDRFLNDLRYIPHGINKENEANIEHMVRSMRYVRLKVYPMEAFEDAAELLECMSTIFEAASGERIKRALALTLNQMLEAIVVGASAEVNHPIWSRAMQIIFAKASDMGAKPRYITAAMPLMITSVSASPEDFLLANFNNCLNLCITKLKERATRIPALYGILQLLWSYLRRCHETHTAVSRRLDPIVKTIFPPGRRVIYPSDVPPIMTATVPHLLFQHHAELGGELIDALLNPCPPISTDHWPPEALCHERMHCAITALLYSLDVAETGKDPVMPPAPHVEGESFSQPLPLASPPVTPLPESLLARGGWRRVVDTSSAAVARIAIACDKACESFKVLDDRNIVFQAGAGHPHFQAYTQDRENYIQRRHGAFTVTYPRDKQPLFDLLRSCIDSWPRLLAKPDAVTDFRPADILIRCLLHIDIDVYIAARKALERLTAQADGYLYVRALTRSIVRPELVLRESSSLQNANTVKLESLVGLWNALVEILSQQIEAAAEASQKPAPAFGLRRPGGSAVEENVVASFGDPHDIWLIITDVEATALVLLISQSALIRRRAADVLQLALKMQTNLQDWMSNTSNEALVDQEPRVLSCLQQSGASLLEQLDEDAQGSVDRSRLRHWKRQTGDNLLLRLAQSETLPDLSLWQQLIAPTFKSLLGTCPSVVSLARVLFTDRLVKGYGMASSAAGLVPGRPTAGPMTSRGGIVTQASSLPTDLRFITDYWKMHLSVVCAITTPTPREDAPNSSSLRDASDLSSPADVVRAAIPFLASDEAAFREATIFGLGSIHQSGYRDLLQGLNQNIASLRAGMDLRHRHGPSHSNAPPTSSRHLRTYASVIRVYERSSILLRQWDIADAELGLVAHSLQDMLKTIIAEHLPLDCRKAFSVTLRNFVEQCGKHSTIKKWLSPPLLFDCFRSCEQWSFFQKTHSSVGSKSSHAHPHGHHHREHSRSRSDGTPEPAYEIFLPAVHAVASLCEHNAVTLKRHPSEPSAVDLTSPLRWAQNLFMYTHPIGHTCAKRAIRALINYNLDHKSFQDYVVQQCYAEPADLPLHQSTFSVFSGALIAEPTLAVKSWTALSLALWKVGQPDLATRQRALDVITLRLPAEQRAEILTNCQAAIYSHFIGNVLDMRYRLCKIAADADIVDPKQAFLEFGIRILQNKDKQTRSRLQLLPIWLAKISLPTKADRSSADTVLANVFLVTSQYWDIYPSEIRAMWTSLISSVHTHNLQSVVQFLVGQTQFRGFKEFTKDSQQCLAAICSGEHDARVLALLSELAQPSTSLVGENQTVSELKTTNLEAKYAHRKKTLHLSTAQTAVLLASDVLLTRLHTADPNSIRILHVLLLQADHPVSYIRREARDILQRAMTLLKKLDRVNQAADSIALAGSAEVEWSWHSFWDHNEESTSPSTRRTVPNMERFIQDALQLLEGHMIDVRRIWGVVALEWAVACPVRHMACRSFQSLRLLCPPSDQRMLADILNRLSTTIADTAKAPDARLFARETLHTLVTMAEANETPLAELPQMWWSFLACSTTTNEDELVASLLFGQAVLDRLADDETAIAAVQNFAPEGWASPFSSIRNYIIRGVRSAATINGCWEFAQCLMRPSAVSELTEAGSCFHLVYSFTLQWGLDAMETAVFPSHFDSHCVRLAQWAEHFQEDGIARVCKSLGKNRFRTKDDFVREAASTMKEYFSADELLDTYLLYLGSLQNALVWVRDRTLVLLKSFFHQVQLSQSDVEHLGPDQLSPLIQLLTTDMASTTLDVLSEHVPLHSKIWNRSAQANSARSAQDGLVASHQSTPSDTKPCFGKPELSGWSVGSPEEDAATTRLRLRQVIDTCDTVSADSDVSRPLTFAAEDPNIAEGFGDVTKTGSSEAGDTSTVADMMNTLSSLADFWDSTLEATPSIRASQSVGNAPRIAAVLSRSLRSHPSHSSHISKSSNFSMSTIPELPPSPPADADPAHFDEVFVEAMETPLRDPSGEARTGTTDGEYFGPRAAEGILPWDFSNVDVEENHASNKVQDANDPSNKMRPRPFGWTRQG